MRQRLYLGGLRIAKWLGYNVVFVSYRRNDCADISGRLYDCLARRYGSWRVFRDVNSMPLGTDFRHFIQRFIPSCNVMLVVISPDWYPADGIWPADGQRDVVRLELAYALKQRMRIIPVLVGSATFPEPEMLPPELSALAGLHGMRLRGDPDFYADVDRLIRALGV